MIKNVTQKVMKEVEETVSSVGICDVCGKEFNYESKFARFGRGDKIASYYHIVTGHYDWGNDSCESREGRDACCNECLSKFTQEWLKNKDVISSSTAYIEINKDTHVLKEADKNEKST